MSKEEYVLAGELLFQFADQTALDLLEFSVLAVRDKDDIGLFVGDGDGHFFGGSEVKLSQFGTEVFAGHLELNESTSDLLFKRRQGFIVSLEYLLEVRSSVYTQVHKTNIETTVLLCFFCLRWSFAVCWMVIPQTQ